MGPKQSLNVLLVEDDPIDARLIEAFFGNGNRERFRLRSVDFTAKPQYHVNLSLRIEFLDQAAQHLRLEIVVRRKVEIAYPQSNVGHRIIAGNIHRTVREKFGLLESSGQAVYLDTVVRDSNAARDVPDTVLWGHYRALAGTSAHPEEYHVLRCPVGR